MVAAAAVLDQLAPPSVDLNTPPWLAANTVWESTGSIARLSMDWSPSPTFAVFHVPPPSTLLRTPPPKMPAYTVSGSFGSMATASTAPPRGPMLDHSGSNAKAGKRRIQKKMSALGVFI